MKVIIPVSDNQAGKNSIAPRFHNAEYVCVFDCSSKSFEWHKAKEMNSNGNLGEELINKQIFSVISNQMPAMALGVFIDNGLKVYKAVGNNVLKNIEMFQNNQLRPYSTEESRMVSACSGSCGSCSSTSCN